MTLDQIREEIKRFMKWEEETEEWQWINKGKTEDGEETIDGRKVLSLLAELLFALEEEVVSHEWFDRHYHTQRDAVVDDIEFRT